MAQQLFRRHWQRALILRDWFRLNEEAVNLLLAGAVGVIGGVTTWIYFWVNRLVQWCALGEPGDILEIAEKLSRRAVEMKDAGTSETLCRRDAILIARMTIEPARP